MRDPQVRSHCTVSIIIQESAIFIINNTVIPIYNCIKVIKKFYLIKLLMGFGQTKIHLILCDIWIWIFRYILKN